MSRCCILQRCRLRSLRFIQCGDSPLAPRGRLAYVAKRRLNPQCDRQLPVTRSRHVSAHAWEAPMETALEEEEVAGQPAGGIEGVQQQGSEPALAVWSKRPLPGRMPLHAVHPPVLKLSKGGRLSGRRSFQPPGITRIAPQPPATAHRSAVPPPLHQLLQHTLGIVSAGGSGCSDAAEPSSGVQQEEEPAVVVLRGPACRARALAYLIPIMQQVGGWNCGATGLACYRYEEKQCTG